MEQVETGSYISIGLVFNGREFISKEKTIDTVLLTLKKNGAQIKNCKYSKDPDGENWITIEINEILNSNNLSQILVNNFNGNISILLPCNDCGLTAIFSFHNIDEDYFGILIEIPERQLLSYNSDNVAEAEEWAINMISLLYNSAPFSYSFCDNEAEIEYSLEDLADKIETAYSLTVIPEKEGLQLIKNAWFIDGLTKR